MPTPARKRDQRPSGEEKVSPDPKIPRQEEDHHASNTENMAAAFHASAESSSPESNSDMKEIKEMLAVIQSQMATVLSDNRKIRDLETLKESMNMQDRELKQTQQQLTKAVAQSDLLKKELVAAHSGNNKRKSTICGVSRKILNNILAKNPWNCTESHAVHILPPKRRCSR